MARMRGNVVRLSFLFAAVVAGCQASGATPAPTPTAASTPAAKATLAIVHGRLWDGTGAPVVADAVVLVDGDRIVAAGPARSIVVPAGIKTVDAGGGTILPGFINAHVHRGFSQSNLQAWAEGGVTTVRDESTSASQVDGLAALRAQIAANPHLARLVSAGSMLAVPGGYGDLTVATTDEALAAVDRESLAGADAVKVALEDGYAGTSGLPKPSPEMLRAIVERAHAKGLPVSGHVTQAAYVEGLVDAGVDDVAHAPYDAISDAVLRRMVDGKVALVPTFTVFRTYGAPVDGCVDNVRRFHEIGGLVALGNDYGGGPGEFELGIPMYEVEQLAAAGLTPAEVLEASTRDAARVLRKDKEIGTIEAGKQADILIVGGDPLADLQALRHVRTVLHVGVVIRDV